MMRVIFMGTPAFAVPALQALIDSPHEVIAAYSQPPRPAGRGMKLTPSPVHQLAERHGIPVHTPQTLKTPDAQAVFRAYAADIAVVAAYGLLLPNAVLEAPKHGCINIHPSDLPHGRGAAPIQRTLMEGITDTACCIIQLEQGLDTGPILAREPYRIPPEMDAGGLHYAMSAIGARQVLAVLEGFEMGTITAQPQAHNGVSYAAKITKEDRLLDFAQSAQLLQQRIRGLSPTQAAVITLRGEAIKIFAAVVESGDATQPPGMVLDDRLLINAGQGTALRPISLQRPGKSRVSLDQFLQGFPSPAGLVAQNTLPSN